MEHIKEGNYYTLTDIALRLDMSKSGVLKRAKKLGIEPLKFGRLSTRYHENDAKAIIGLGPKRR